MKIELENPMSFQGNLLPKGSRLAGLTALLQTLSLEVPVRHFTAVAEKHIRGGRKRQNNWLVLDKRAWPGDTVGSHLSFALRHEVIDLLVFKRIFEGIPQTVIEQMVKATPTGPVARRLWYYYEMLMGPLDLPDAASNIAAVDLLPEKDYYTAEPIISKRHRVRDNLLGGAAFCPVIRRTETLEGFISENYAQKAKQAVGRIGNHLISRAASFMLLADSRASFEIEGERPPRKRLERWGRAVAQAGKNELKLDELIRLQQIIIEDKRFVKEGLRCDGIFLGERDEQNDPLPEFIGARPEDIEDLIEGLLYANRRMKSAGVDPVLQAVATAFGFVYIHPFQDGNGRLHRYLLHHVLAERGFTPTGMVFPVSSVIYDRIDDYRETLVAHSGALLACTDWRPTAEHNVEVLNDTADLYRYMDCTQASEFIYACVQRTVEQDLPREIDFLQRNDEALRRLRGLVEMPELITQNLLMFIRQNDGALPKKRRLNEFELLTDTEVEQAEKIVRDVFDGFEQVALS